MARSRGKASDGWRLQRRAAGAERSITAVVGDWTSLIQRSIGHRPSGRLRVSDTPRSAIRRPAGGTPPGWPWARVERGHGGTGAIRGGAGGRGGDPDALGAAQAVAPAVRPADGPPRPGCAG